ncbi:hypothetical protein PZ897_02155 [Hoeflea sp. YIM 152468]|uniref:hypothetical protein n=1 Tax=Hoeflea sp. YIM 152468 TaxID=3031759 RepID=UPI0023DBDC7A|nr:hypothetical protein [Hoeflea sp. YIM 152468]MDF1606974.1 hypothetical protein [Hoeflea sp. YIM 152468]
MMIDPFMLGWCVVGGFGLAVLVRKIWRAGFAAGIRSVPLDGAGLASGDDRAFDYRHHWNPALGAWEKPKVMRHE